MASVETQLAQYAARLNNLEAQNDDLTERIQKHREDGEEDFNKLDGRLTGLELWRAGLTARSSLYSSLAAGAGAAAGACIPLLLYWLSKGGVKP